MLVLLSAPRELPLVPRVLPATILNREYLPAQHAPRARMLHPVVLPVALLVRRVRIAIPLLPFATVVSRAPLSALPDQQCAQVVQLVPILMVQEN